MRSTLYVNLSTIGKNLEAVNLRTAKKVQNMAVVKDEAYGHGLLPVANYLKDKVEWFCTARIEEAVQLREAGIKNPILVFEIPPKGKESLYKEYDITASIPDLNVFDRLNTNTKVHLHFDTGMFRLGLLPDQVSEAKHKMKGSQLNYTGIYTHFANSDEERHDRVSKQLEVFKNIRAEFPEDLLTHTANSGAIFYYHNKGLLFDAVRPGVCLYGYAPGSVEINDLEPVVEWKSKLVQVKKIEEGDYVGYGSRWQAPKEGWIGVLPVGYSDGIFRNLSGLFKVEIAGEEFEQVGTISMDYLTIYLKDRQYKEGEEVTILSSGDFSAKEWAKKMGTIPYEITTAISPKVKREYIL